MKAPLREERRAHGLPVPQLAVLRKQAGLSQRILAARAGLCIQTVSRLEQGANARYDTIELLAQALQIPPARLLQTSRRRVDSPSKGQPKGIFHPRQG